MKIALLVHNSVEGGTFQRAHSLGRHLVKRGHAVTLLAGGATPGVLKRGTLEGVELVESFDLLPRRARESGLSAFDIASRFAVLFREKWDLVHCFEHRPSVSLPGLVLRRTRRAACVFDWADLWGAEGIAAERGALARLSLGALDGFMENRVRHFADALTVINTALLQRAGARFSAPVHLLPVGANSDLIHPLPQTEARRQLGLPFDRAIALHAGLAPYDITYLARSFIALAKMHPGALLVIAGRPFANLRREVAAAGLSDHVLELGMLDRTALTTAMACSDVLLLPYTDRAVNRFRYPNKLGDYLSAGRAIVTNRTGDLGKLVLEEDVGVVAEDTPEAFATAIKQLFDDQPRREELGRRGRALAESKLDWRFLAAGLESFYDQTLARVAR